MLPQHFDLRAEYSRVTPSPFSRRFFQKSGAKVQKKSHICKFLWDFFCVRGMIFVSQSFYFHQILGVTASGIYINLRFPMRRRKASHQRVGSSQWKKTIAFAILPMR